MYRCITVNYFISSNLKSGAEPIAVIAGQDDPAINNDYIINEVSFANLWRSQVHLIPGAGHAPHYHQSEAFNALLAAFLNKLLIVIET
jgi:pimeloyl-ACP methyl ester carboxylesterase